MSYYAVAKGRNVGIYRTWDECKAQVDKYPGAAFKKFGTETGAASFISEKSGSSSGYSNSSTSGSTDKNNLLKSSYNSNNNRGSSSGSSGSSGFWGSKLSSTYSSGQISTSLKRPYSSISTSKNESSTSSRKSPSSTKINDDNKNFTYDSNGRVDIYTDGACSGNGNKHAKAGYGVYFGDNHFANTSKPVKGRATNNNAEIQAVTEAAIIAKSHGLKKIRINTDSEFLINCTTKWMPKWKKKGWKTSSGHVVINREELENMDRALQKLDVQFTHVRGHAGIHGNEMADSLARLGAEDYVK